MSRHKLVKGLDVEEELDDFDGDYGDDYEEYEGTCIIFPSGLLG